MVVVMAGAAGARAARAACTGRAAMTMAMMMFFVSMMFFLVVVPIMITIFATGDMGQLLFGQFIQESFLGLGFFAERKHGCNLLY